jgi:hypothetical protein
MRTGLIEHAGHFVQQMTPMAGSLRGCSHGDHPPSYPQGMHEQASCMRGCKAIGARMCGPRADDLICKSKVVAGRFKAKAGHVDVQPVQVRRGQYTNPSKGNLALSRHCTAVWRATVSGCASDDECGWPKCGRMSVATVTAAEAECPVESIRAAEPGSK